MLAVTSLSIPKKIDRCIILSILLVRAFLLIERVELAGKLEDTKLEDTIEIG